MECHTDSDCGWHAMCTAECVCEVYPLFSHPVADLLMGVLSFVIAGISLAAGVGGGGMFVPLLMMFLSFNAKIATALSQCMLLGGAIAAFIYNLDHSHPQVPTRPLVDFQLACLLGASLMAGSQVGSVVHAVAPPAILLLLLCVVLADAARKGVSNALKIRAKEKDAAAHKPHQDATTLRLQAAPAASSKAVAVESSSESEDSATTSSSGVDDDEAAERIGDAKCKIFFLWLFCVAVVLSRNLIFHVCAAQWWALVVAAAVLLGGFGLYYAFQLSTEVPVDEHCLDFRQLALPLVKWSLVAGVLAAMCGIGGGMVMGPILVDLKVPPPVSSATTATTLLVLSSSVALVYICRGVAPKDYSIYLSLITAIGAFSGKVVIGRWVKRTGRESVLVWALAGITIASTLLMGTLGIIRVYESGWAAFHLGTLCTVVDDQTAGHQLLKKGSHGLTCGGNITSVATPTR